MAATSDENRQRIFREYLDAVGLHGIAGAEAVGLGPTDWYAVSTISLHGPLTAGDLAARVGLSPGATTRLVDRLERRGFVRRVNNLHDRRRLMIEPATDALNDVDQVVQPARTLIADVLDSYTDDQLDLIFDYFKRAAPAYRAATHRIRATRNPSTESNDASATTPSPPRPPSRPRS
ncbi:MarR family transcriptional regulator [Mycolicibacterium boenickei]